jgi:hypothetical protein
MTDINDDDDEGNNKNYDDKVRIYIMSFLTAVDR